MKITPTSIASLTESQLVVLLKSVILQKYFNKILTKRNLINISDKEKLKQIDHSLSLN